MSALSPYSAPKRGTPHPPYSAKKMLRIRGLQNLMQVKWRLFIGLKRRILSGKGLDGGEIALRRKHWTAGFHCVQEASGWIGPSFLLFPLCANWRK